MNYIIDHPEEWGQSRWHCGTKHCFFGHCQILAGRPANDDVCHEEVQELLGISCSDGDWLSDIERTAFEIHSYVKNWVNKGKDISQLEKL